MNVANEYKSALWYNMRCSVILQLMRALLRKTVYLISLTNTIGWLNMECLNEWFTDFMWGTYESVNVSWLLDIN